MSRDNFFSSNNAVVVKKQFPNYVPIKQSRAIYHIINNPKNKPENSI